LNPVLEPNPENGNIDNNNTLNLGDAELKPSQEFKPEDKLEPTDISTPTSVPTKPKKNKSKMPPITVQTRSARLNEALDSDSDSDTDIKKVTFDENA